jgi:hypothetical protein
VREHVREEVVVELNELPEEDEELLVTPQLLGTSGRGGGAPVRKGDEGERDLDRPVHPGIVGIHGVLQEADKALKEAAQGLRPARQGPGERVGAGGRGE